MKMGTNSVLKSRHSCGSRNPVLFGSEFSLLGFWIPVFTGMTATKRPLSKKLIYYEKGLFIKGQRNSK